MVVVVVVVVIVVMITALVFVVAFIAISGAVVQGDDVFVIILSPIVIVFIAIAAAIVSADDVWVTIFTAVVVVISWRGTFVTTVAGVTSFYHSHYYTKSQSDLNTTLPNTSSLIL